MTTNLAAPRVVRERHVLVLEPADDRAAPRPFAGAATVEPAAACMGRRDGPEERDRVRHAGSPFGAERSEHPNGVLMRGPRSERNEVSIRMGCSCGVPVRSGTK